MPESIENYIPQSVLKGLKRNALTLWAVVLFLVSAWALLILVAPITKYYGLIDISHPIYSFYSYVCHQMPSRSFHALGHQFAVCSRCAGVYFGLMAGLLAYPLFRSMEEISPFPRIWLFLSLVPMAIDWSLTFFGIW